MAVNRPFSFGIKAAIIQKTELRKNTGFYQKMPTLPLLSG